MTSRIMPLLGTLLVALVALLAPLSTAAAAPAPVSATFDRQYLGPGEVEVYWIQRQPPAIRRFIDHPRIPWHQLTPAAEAALALAPLRMRPALFDKLGQLPVDIQDGLAAVIEQAHAEDPRYVDEVAFCVAHIAREELAPGAFPNEHGEEAAPLDPQLLLENVRALYAADARLPYVELVELGGGLTTTRYRMRLGDADHFWELDWQDYYWWVVHPRTGTDHTGYVDPHTGAPAARDEGGRFWRTYLARADPEPDYAREFSLRLPLAISDGELAGWGPTARGWLESVEIDPLVVAARPDNGQPVWLRYSYHHANAGGTGNGTVIATLMPVERAYEQGHSDLLVNLVHQGDGVVAMVPGGAGNRVLVLKDRDPFGAATVEDVLAAEGFAYDVMDSTAFAAIPTWEAFWALDYEKLLVPSDQPRRLYQRLADQRAVVDGWVGRADRGDDCIFQLHGALDPAHAADDWSDLTLPGGLRGHALDNPVDAVEIRGYPRPMAVLEGTESAWDGAAYPGLSGDRPLDPDRFALDKLGWLVSQNLDDNVAELPADFAGPDGGQTVVRTEEAERVIYGHYGNCGENAHLWTAAGRLGLLPVAEVGSHAEDHVWNEIRLDGRWLACQTDWSDNATRIDHPKNGADRQHGGGKDLTVVSAERGDGLLLNRTARYSDTVTLQLRVVDAAGLPADSARVMVATENYYDPDALSLTTVAFADATGRAAIEVGEHRNYYLQVTHPAGGAWPDAEHVSLVACAEPGAVVAGGETCPADRPTTDATGVTLPLELELEGPALPTLEATALPADAFPLSDHRLTFSFGLSAQVGYGRAYEGIPRTHTRWATEPTRGLRVYLVDQDNLVRYQQGEPFEALHAWVEGLGASGSLALPDTGTDWFLLVSADRFGSTAHHFDLELSYQPPGDATDLPPDDGPDAGCGCRAPGGAGPPASRRALPWLLLLLGAWLRRRRAPIRRFS